MLSLISTFMVIIKECSALCRAAVAALTPTVCFMQPHTEAARWLHIVRGV